MAYLFRKTLGWCDEHGNPQETQVLCSYGSLIRDAGIARPHIPDALERAEAANYIKCVRKSSPSFRGKSAVSRLYEIKWDESSSEYITDPKRFLGFFAGEGNRTYAPNVYFDYTVRYEPLAVTKVVGTIMRNTIGWTNKFGHRRQNITMSLTDIQHACGIKGRETVTEAIQTALKHNHFLLLDKGCFDRQGGMKSKPASYSIKWLDEGTNYVTGYKTEPGSTDTERPKISEPVTKSNRDPGLEENVTGYKIEPATSLGSSASISKPVTKSNREAPATTGYEIEPEPVTKSDRNRLRNRTDIKIKPLNNTTKQQHSVAEQCVNENGLKKTTDVRSFNNSDPAYRKLLEAGYSQSAAKRMRSRYDPDLILRQCEWIEHRVIKTTKLGLLTTCIQEDIPPPQSKLEANSGREGEFVSHFYAALGGNNDAPVSTGTTSDQTHAQKFITHILSFDSDEAHLNKWARKFGHYVRQAEMSNPKMPSSLVLSITRHGDAFVVEQKQRFESQINQQKKERLIALKEKLRPNYLEYLGRQLEQLPFDHPEMFQAFSAEEDQAKRTVLAQSSDAFKEEGLRMYNLPAARRDRFERFLSKQQSRFALSFDEWFRQHIRSQQKTTDVRNSDAPQLEPSELTRLPS